MYGVSLACLIPVAFSTLACLLVGRLFGLTFGKEAGEVKVPYLHDRSLTRVKLVFGVQVMENEMMM